jgi:CRISPR locus-related DNA-binding protein
VIIATTGEQPAGIIESLKIYNCEKLILFADDRSKKMAVPKILNAAEVLNIQTEVVTIDPYDILGMINQFKKKILENQGKEIILNVTGGRKTMGIAATLVGMIMGRKVQDVIYITEEEHKPVSLPRPLNPEALLTNEKKAILHILEQKIEATAEEIQEKMDVGLQAVWKHLRELEELGYVTGHKGKPRKFRLTSSGILIS